MSFWEDSWWEQQEQDWEPSQQQQQQQQQEEEESEPPFQGGCQEERETWLITSSPAVTVSRHRWTPSQDQLAMMQDWEAPPQVLLEPIMGGQEEMNHLHYGGAQCYLPAVSTPSQDQLAMMQDWEVAAHVPMEPIIGGEEKMNHLHSRGAQGTPSQDELAMMQDWEVAPQALVQPISGGDTNQAIPMEVATNIPMGLSSTCGNTNQSTTVMDGKRERNIWTREEHRRFLIGLKACGRKWKTISRDFVGTKSMSQVASHAQKFFIRQSATREHSERESIHDLVIDDSNNLVHYLQLRPQIKECSKALLHDVSQFVSEHVELPTLFDDFTEMEMIAMELDDYGTTKGMPWTEEEHGLFLYGLNVYGRGNWTDISRYCVVTRSTSEVASHAQNYFYRQSSIHDITKQNIDSVPQLHPHSQPQPQPQPQPRPRCIFHGQVGCLFCDMKNGL